MPIDKYVLKKESRKWVVAAVIIIAAVVGFSFLDSGAVGNHEAYVGVAARNMIESGDWVVPTFNGQPRLQKTPLCYWLVASAGMVVGQVNDFALRLPSAVLAVLSVIAILYFVSERFGLRIAAISAMFWVLSLGYIRYGHTGRPEMALASFVTIAMLSFYSGLKTQSRKKQIRYMLVFWISFALAMLAKGPAPLPLILPALFFYMAVFRKFKAIPKLLPIVGVIVFLLIVVPWPVMAGLKCPQAIGIWKDEFFGRAAGEYASGGKPFYYYFRVIFTLFAPWVAFVPLAVMAPFYRVWERKQKPMLYFWFWLVVSILMMTVAGGKRAHYILPAIPALAVLSGIILDDMLFIRKAYSKKFATNFVLIHIIAVVTVGIGLGIWSLKNKKELDHNAVIKDFALKTSQILEKGQDLTAYCKVNSSFIYYFDGQVGVETDLEKIYELYSNGGSIIATGRNLETLESDGRFKVVFKGLDNGRGLLRKE